MSMKYKFFAALLGAVCAVIVGMYFLMQWSFDRGFLRYVNTLEAQRLDALAKGMEEIYADLGRWEPLRENSMLWRRLLRSSFPAEWLATAPENSSARASGPPRHGMGHGPGEGFFARRVVLLDNQRSPVVAPPDFSDVEWFQPLTVAGKTVGYLGLIPQRRLSSVHQLEFAAEQKQTFLLIALAMAAGAALLSLPLATGMVRRIKRLAMATHLLAAGRFTVRVADESSDEIGQLAHDFNALALTLERNEQARRQWIADISHELRTPLAVLRGEIEALQDGVRPPDPPAIDSLHGEVMRLHRLVEDLYELSLSDLGALSYRKELLNPLDVLADTIREYRDSFERADIAIVMRWPEEKKWVVFGDSARLHQLFSNLLSNTLKYTDPPGQLEIELSQREDDLVFDFMDSSPGVSDQDLSRIFERLYRVETSRSRATGGGGLGLSICRNIVEAHGGTIEARRSPLGGVWVRVVLSIGERA